MILTSDETDTWGRGAPPGQAAPPNMGIQTASDASTVASEASPPSQLRRLNEEGDSAPGGLRDELLGSQDLDLARRTDRSLTMTVAVGTGLSGASPSAASSGMPSAAAATAAGNAILQAVGRGDDNDGGEGEEASGSTNRRGRSSASASARLLRATIAEAPPPPEPPSIATFPGGAIACPWCSRTFDTGPSLMRHVTTMHAG